MNPVLYYAHDPMCSWCWGFSSAFNELLDKLPVEVEVQRILGGLAMDSDVPMPESMQQQIKTTWKQIENMISGVSFNYDFWEKNIPRRSTYSACRAVIAARQQGNKYDTEMTKAIQKAYYQQARNPSNNSTLIELAAEIGLNTKYFIQTLNSKETKQQLINEINLSRSLFIESFPSLVLQLNDEHWSINIDYSSYIPMYRQIVEKIN